MIIFTNTRKKLRGFLQIVSPAMRDIEPRIDIKIKLNVEGMIWKMGIYANY